MSARPSLSSASSASLASGPNFYAQLPTLPRLNDLTQPENYHPVPPDWWIAHSDVRGSTAAIQRGQQRDVNAVAAATITALFNVAGEIDVPFVFGGDGATVLVPPVLKDAARDALRASRNLARDAFGLDLRVGLIPVLEVNQAGYDIRVARLHRNEHYQQAIFSGGGLAYADKLLKEDPRYDLSDDDAPTPAISFQGFECRWTEIESASEATLSLLVMALGDPMQQNATYTEVLQLLEKLYGDKAARHPLAVANMRVHVRPDGFRREALIKQQDHWWVRWRIAAITQLGRFFMRFKLFGWERYMPLFIDTTDHEKFDDMLRMTLTSTHAQRDQLRAELERLHAEGKLVFGLHSAERVLVTCIVYDYFGRQVHFVDGGDGGYAMAALEFKAQLNALAGG